MPVNSELRLRVFPETTRTLALKKAFAETFKKSPEFYVRVPGRVNLIGEHVDYCGYSVCPMALEQDILLAVSCENAPVLQLCNLDPKFTNFQCDFDGLEIIIGDGAPKWHQYFLCGVKGILEILPKDFPVKGMNVLVSGNVPQGAGLSSSSALVSAAALAASQVNQQNLSKEKLASLCADCERYIGTQGGGMDQAIAFLATEGCAKLIEFNPLRATDVTLPPDAVFVIAHSMSSLNKAATGDFNQRVVECRLATQVLAKAQNLPLLSHNKLGDLQKALNVSLQEMVNLVDKTFHEVPYSKQEICDIMNINVEQLLEMSLLTKNTISVEEFWLKKRATHVFQEAQRVQKFFEICNKTLTKDTLQQLGTLMSESHQSLKDLYECSHPQLDRIVEMSKPYTLGTRLTGAGWGGCTVSLVKKEKVDAYIDFLKEHFYKPLGVSSELDSLIFSTTPMGGACIFKENI